MLAGCGDDKGFCGGCLPRTYYDPTSEANVLFDFQKSYQFRDVDEYGLLLADDFRFYFDPETRIKKNLPEFWNRTEDSTGTALSLFKSDKISDIRITLKYVMPAQPVTGPGHERWTRVSVEATLDVDQQPDPSQPEGITFQVINRQEVFCFRQGRSPADTLAASRTSNQYFLVEWREPAVARKPGIASATSTWSGLKTLYR